MRLSEIAERLSCDLEGDGFIEIDRVAGLDEAGPGALSFFANRRYAPALRRTRASAVIAAFGEEGAPCAVLRTSAPYLTFARAVALFADPWRPPAGVHPSACVEPGAIIGRDVSIGPFAVVAEGARVGDRTIVSAHVVIGRSAAVGEDCVLHAHASIRERVRLGHRVVVQDGAVIGSDGYGFARTPEGTHYKIPQIGGVVIEDDVEIGANTTIDRPAVGETRIAAGTKIDNLVQVAHGVRIGRHALLAAQAGVAGSAIIEDHVTLAGQVGVVGHLTVGRGAVVTAQSGVAHSVEAGAFVSGSPAFANRDWLKASAAFRRLPELRKLLAELERRIAAIEAGGGGEP
jgi:UDP-3-O-[3-hydroxymyristoyl] glucosamine N-acyltransferase